MSGDGNRLEEWKKAGECRDFPQPWSDYLWSLEFEHRPDDAKAFHSVAKAVCEQCPVRAECLAYAASGGLEWGVYGGKVCTDRAGPRAWPKPTASPAGTAACRGHSAGGCSRTGSAPT